MDLIIPYLGEISASDEHFFRLAKLYGLECQLLRLTSGASDPVKYIDSLIHNKNASFAINPAVIGKWLSTEIFPAKLALYLISRFPIIFIHSINPGSIAVSAIRLLSENRIEGIIAPCHPERGYHIAPGTEDICDHFSGISFGPANNTKDRVFQFKEGIENTRPLIFIDNQPIFIQIKLRKTEVFLLAVSEISNLETNITGAPLASYFSQLLPPAMFLRYAFGDECWRPSPPQAALIIDDPPLWKNYGFLNFDRLIALLDKYNFHLSIAFIPYYYRRDTPSVVNLFKERSDRLSICFHGNDHSAAELGCNDMSILNTTLAIARTRMEAHFKNEGIACDNVMVFPQGKFSTNTISALKAHNFLAAVNGGYTPSNERRYLPLSELLKPATLKYSNFPFFLRKYVRSVKPEDIAFNVFFGRPILLYEHHEIFKDVEFLLDTVMMINRLVPDIKWTNLQTIVENTYLTRCRQDKAIQIRAFAKIVRIKNTSDKTQKCFVEWTHTEVSEVKTLMLEGKPVPDFGLENGGIGLALELPSNSTQSLSIIYRNDFSNFKTRQTFFGTIKTICRRSLSEFRDNYLARHPTVLSLVMSLLFRVKKS